GRPAWQQGTVPVRHSFPLSGLGAHPRRTDLVVVAVPHLPWGPFRRPKLLEMILVSERVHGLPETVMLVGAQAPRRCQIAQWLLFPRGLRSFDVVEPLRRKREEAAVNPGSVAEWLLDEAVHAAAVELQTAEPSWGAHSRDGGNVPLLAMKIDNGRDV